MIISEQKTNNFINSICWLQTRPMHLHVCVYACVCVCVCVCPCVSLYVCVGECVCPCECMCADLWMWAWVHVLKWSIWTTLLFLFYVEWLNNRIKNLKKNQGGRRNVIFCRFNSDGHRMQHPSTFPWMLSSVENLQLDNNNNSTTYNIQLIVMRKFGLLCLAY